MDTKEFSAEDIKKELESAWKSRLEIYAKVDKLYAEINKLYAEGDKLYAEGSKLRAEINKLYAEAERLRLEGDILWFDAIIKVCGNIKIDWEYNNETSGYDCHLETGEVFYWKNIDE